MLLYYRCVFVMSTNKKVYLLFLIITFIIYISLPVILGKNTFDARLFVIFPLLFFGAFLFSSNNKKKWNSNKLIIVWKMSWNLSIHLLVHLQVNYIVSNVTFEWRFYLRNALCCSEGWICVILYIKYMKETKLYNEKINRIIITLSCLIILGFCIFVAMKHEIDYKDKIMWKW